MDNGESRATEPGVRINNTKISKMTVDNGLASFKITFAYGERDDVDLDEVGRVQ